jgi:hypothetical protein
MTLVLKLSTLTVRNLVEGASTAMGVAGAGDVAAAVVSFLKNGVRDHSECLIQVLHKANERAWKALEMSLAGETLWERCTAL